MKGWLSSYIVGGLAGAGLAIWIVRDYYRKIADEEIASVKELYSKPWPVASETTNDSEGNSAKKESEVEEEQQVEENEDNSTYVNYANKYTGSGEADYILNTLAESQHPEDDVPVSKKKKNKGKKKGAHLIKAEDYDAYPQYRKLTVYYYLGDGKIADEEDNDELLGVDERSLGKYKDYIPDEVLDKYGFLTDDNQGTVFIRNEDISIDFQVIKDFGSLSDFMKEE